MAVNPNSLENLKGHCFKKGQSGNAAGFSAKGRRKREERILADKQFDELFGKGASKRFRLIDNVSDISWLNKLFSCNAAELTAIAKWNDCPASVKNYAIAMLRDMKDGRTATIDRIRERLYGKPMQIVELTGKGGKDLMPQKDLDEDEIKRIISEMQEGR